MKVVFSLLKHYRISTFLAACLGGYILYTAPPFSAAIVGLLIGVPTLWLLLVMLHLFLVEPLAEAWRELADAVEPYDKP